MAMRAIRLRTDLVGSFHDNCSRFASRFLAAGFQGIAKLLLSLKPVVLIKPVGASALHIYLIGAFANFRLGNLSTVRGYLCIASSFILLTCKFLFRFYYSCCGLFFWSSHHDPRHFGPKLTLHFAQQFAQSWLLGEQPLDGTHRVSNCRGSTVESPRDGGHRKSGVLAAEIESCRTGEPELLGVIVDVQRGGAEGQVVETHRKDLGSRPLDRIDDRLGTIVNGRRGFIIHRDVFVSLTWLPVDAHS